MEIRPILSSLRRNPMGALLIALQIALTLAVLCNALFIVYQRVQRAAEPSGLDEASIFTLRNIWSAPGADLPAQQSADLALLRAMPGVVDAYATNSYPLSDGGWSTGVDLSPEQKHASAHVADYFVDDHALQALGLRLRSGRWFNAEEIISRSENDERSPSHTVVITAPLAEKLFPGAEALGKTLYYDETQATIVGIVERMRVPWTGRSWREYSLLEPNRYIARGAVYVVRTQPGQVEAVMQAAQKQLVAANRERVVTDAKTFKQTRSEAYQDDHALVVVLMVVCALLLAVTAFGIVGLTSFWVAQRRRQIGIRRALGATRLAVVRYFLTENLLIAGAGAVGGATLAFAANFWMVRNFELPRLPIYEVGSGGLMLLTLSVVAALWPALRASSTPPALATRAA